MQTQWFHPYILDNWKQMNFKLTDLFGFMIGCILGLFSNVILTGTVQEVEQTLSILPFCVVFLVSLQTRHYEQYATNFLLLENDKDLDFYGSKCHKMLPLDQQYDTRTIWNKKIHFCKWILQKHMKSQMEKMLTVCSTSCTCCREKKLLDSSSTPEIRS